MRNPKYFVNELIETGNFSNSQKIGLPHQEQPIILNFNILKIFPQQLFQ